MTHHPASKTRCDGDDLRAMFAAAAELFQHNVDLLNRLNVFPVPDGDTGTNMYLTLVDTLSQDGESVNVPARDVAASMARGALWGAKGNSGVILSQFFKGLAEGLDDSEDFGPAEFAHALQLARDFAYKAVGQPREGTMLTVLRYTADAALEAGDSTDMAALLEPVSEAARRAVALTPTMLPVLRQAGVVDAGGHGVLVILEGLRMWAAGETPLEEELSPPDAIGVGEDAGTVSDEFLRGRRRGRVRLLHATAHRGRGAGLGRRAGANERDGALCRGGRRRGGAEGARPRRGPRAGHQLRRVAGNAQPGQD